MAGEQSKEHRGSEVNVKDYVHDLSEHFIRRVAYERREMSAREDLLRELEQLTTICSDLKEKLQSAQTRAHDYETALRRAEARNAYLSRKPRKKLGIGPQSSFEIDDIYPDPGVSRKDFDALTKENIRLKEALEHIVPTELPELGGKDIVIFSEREELLKTIEEKDKHIAEMEASIHQLKETVKGLTELTTELARTSESKERTEKLEITKDEPGNTTTSLPVLGFSSCQPFGSSASECFMSKGSAAWMPWNDILNEEPGKMPKEVDEIERIHKSLTGQKKMNEGMTTGAWDGISNGEQEKLPKEIEQNDKTEPNGFSQDEVEKMMKVIEEKRKQISELQVIIDSMEKNMEKHVCEFTTEVAQVSESKEEIECASKSPFHVPRQEEGGIEDKERIVAEDHAEIKVEAMKKEDEAAEKGSGQSYTFKDCQIEFHNYNFN